LLFTLGIIFAVSLRGSFLPLLLSHKGLSTQAIGSYLSLFALAMILVRLGVGRLMGKVSRSVLVAVALVLVTLGVGSVPFLHDHWALAGALGMFGLGFGISQPLSMVMVSDLASKENSGLVIGIRFMTLTLGTFLSPIILGFVAEVAGLKAPFVVSGLFLLLIIAVLGWARAVAKRRQ
jgi:MFS family permease